MSTLRQRAADGLRQGDTFSITRTFSYAETEEFGRLTRDYNPVHYDRQFAAGKGTGRADPARPAHRGHGLRTRGAGWPGWPAA